MKHINWFIIFATAFLVFPPCSLGISPNELFHVTGCENGTLVVPTINMWSVPGGIAAGATVVGKLSGDGNLSQGLKCQGSVVKALEVKKVNGTKFVKVKAVVNSNVGWITEGFVGKSVSKSMCKQMFSEPDHIKNCLQ